MVQKVGIILLVKNPVVVSVIKQMLRNIDGVEKIIYVTSRSDKHLYIVDEDEYSTKDGTYNDSTSNERTGKKTC